ncbi:MAG: M48 family metallopeptidase [Methylococcaceae bacterium]|nr:M48 family metallopeptidase [Methylococcaceae bacterium]
MSLMYQIRRSVRVRCARIIVSLEKVEVVVPVKMSQQQIALFVSSKQAWITAAVAKVRLKTPAIVPLAPSEYSQGALIPYQGNHYPLNLEATSFKRIHVKFDGAFKVFTPHLVAPAEQHNAIKLALTAWMKNTAKVLIAQHIQRHAQRFNLTPTLVRVKTQKSRWGSCSSTNAININWLLMLAPPVILEYVVVHELCHIKEKNHSAAFWHLVAAHMPDYQQHRNWLKQHGASLMRGL